MSAKTLKKAGLKVTLPRKKVLEIFDGNEDAHFSADDIHRYLFKLNEEIGIATVYRILTQFVEAGLLKRRIFDGGQALFELSRDEHHDHMVCPHCGTIQEFYDEVIENRQKAIAEDRGFKLVDHTMVLYAYCDKPACLKRIR